MSRSGRKSRIRWGWIVLCTVVPIVLLLAGMTLAYPIAAGVLRVGQAGLGSWISYSYRQGQWLVGWTHILRYSADPLVWKAVGLAGAFTIVALSGVSFIVVMLRWQPAKKPDLERKHLRGSRLVEKRDVPDEVIELAASALHGAGSKEMRAWARSARDIEADAEEERRILDHALKNGRPLTPGEARAEARVNAIGRAAEKDGLVRFGNLPLPRQLETLHGLICASTGTGKSVALRQLLADIRRRGDRAIVVDAGYDMSESFRRKGDKVLSPFDGEAVGWNLRNEIKAPHEWQTYAASLFPDQAGESGEWARRARTFLANAAMRAGAQLNNVELFKMITQSDVAELQAPLEAENSATFQKGAEGILGSVRSIIETNLGGLAVHTGRRLSCREYMLGEDPGWLWLPYRDTEKGVLGPSIGARLDILILAGLERASVKDGRFLRTWIGDRRAGLDRRHQLAEGCRHPAPQEQYRRGLRDPGLWAAGGAVRGADGVDPVRLLLEQALPAVQQRRPGREGVEGNRPGRDGGNTGPGGPERQQRGVADHDGHQCHHDDQHREAGNRHGVRAPASSDAGRLRDAGRQAIHLPGDAESLAR